MPTVLIASTLLTGAAIGALVRHGSMKRRLRDAQSKTQRILEEAEGEALDIVQQGKEMAAQIETRSMEDEETDTTRLKHFEEDLVLQEETLTHMENAHASLKERTDQTDARISSLKERLSSMDEDVAQKLEDRSGIKRATVKEEITEKVASDFHSAYSAFVKKYEDVAKDKAEEFAKRAVASVTERYQDKMPYRKHLSFSLKLRNERARKMLLDKKGFIVTYLEKELVTNILFDEENRQIVCSGPHLYRNAIAHGTIIRLLRQRGKIDEPTIKKAMEKTEAKLEKDMVVDADHALKTAKIKGIDIEFKKIIGKLKFRTSYGQNILNHAAEAGQIAALIGHELGADIHVSRLGGFLHDVGKALDHDLGGTHLELSTEMAERFGLTDETVHAIEAHHDDVEIESVEALIVQTGDAISSSRPGARQEFLEKYIERIQTLERTVKEFNGVNHAYAIQAGREVRVKVDSKQVTDKTAPELAHEIAEKIESTLAYPGYVQVSVIRETEAIEYAGAK